MENFDRHVRDAVTVKIIFDKNSISVPFSNFAVAALASFRAGCEELTAGQFQSQGQKIS